MPDLSTTTVPSWIAAVLGVATLAMLASLVLLLKGRAKRSAPSSRDDKMIRRLFIAALVPSLLVIGCVMAISFVGLASFAQTDMGWHSWISYIVPVSLDGISITFGFWAFVAVKRGRHPGRSERIVYVGALISAWINYNHGREAWTGAAGIYLGFLSLASAWMFHELLNQFMDSQEAAPKTRRVGVPMFGERWLWAPISTLMARRAWVVYPPSPDVESTAANALAHLDSVPALKATRKLRQQASIEAYKRQLAQNLTTPTIPTYINPAPTSPAPAQVPVPTHVSVPAQVSVPATVVAAAAMPAEPAAAPMPTPAEIADRITSKPQPPVRLADATPARPVPSAIPATTGTPKATAALLTPSSTDNPVAAKDAVQLMLPMTNPAVLARATEIAREYRATNGKRITPGQLQVRMKDMRLTSDQATTLLASIDDTPDVAQTVNGRPVTA